MRRRAVLRATGGLVTAAGMGAAAFATPAAADPASGRGYVDVQLLNITDLHGTLQPPTTDGAVITGAGGATLTVGGIGYLATHLARLREGWHNSIFYSAGDNFSGWPFYIDAQNNEPTIEALNALGLRFSSVGNHELDKGPRFLIDHMERGRPYPVDEPFSSFTDSTGRRFRGADWQYYSGNAIHKESGRLIVPPYNVEWVDAGYGRRLPIGFVHATVQGFEGVGAYGTFNCSYQPGLSSLDPVGTINRYAAELKRRGVHAIVVCMHEGGYAGPDYDAGTDPTGPAFDIAARVDPDIAAIVTGHWHCRFNIMVPGPDGVARPVVEAGYNGQVVNELRLKLDPHTGRVVRDLTVSVNHAVTRDVPVDERLQDIADYWSGQADKLAAVPLARQTGDLTRTANAAGESTLGNLVADFLLWDSTLDGRSAAELALVPAKPVKGVSQLRGDLPDRDGVILFGAAWNAVGYDSPIVTIGLTGENLRQALEQQWRLGTPEVFTPLAVSDTVRYTFDPGRPIGQRIAEVTVDGSPLGPARTYRVAVNSYTLLGQDGFTALTVFTDPVRHSLDKEGWIRFLRGRTVTPPALGRATPAAS
jgi:5'-nucleotidase